MAVFSSKEYDQSHFVVPLVPIPVNELNLQHTHNIPQNTRGVFPPFWLDDDSIVLYMEEFASGTIDHAGERAVWFARSLDTDACCFGWGRVTYLDFGIQFCISNHNGNLSAANFLLWFSQAGDDLSSVLRDVKSMG